MKETPGPRSGLSDAPPPESAATPGLRRGIGGPSDGETERLFCGLATSYRQRDDRPGLASLRRAFEHRSELTQARMTELLKRVWPDL